MPSIIILSRHLAAKRKFCAVIAMSQVVILPSFWHYYIVKVKQGGHYMAKDTVKFTVRIDPETLKKFHYVAEYNARSANREIHFLIRRHIAKFEEEHGKIDPADLED
jgi:hypothetical protein